MKYLFLFVLMLGFASEAHAESTERFALIVTNNNSQVLGRPNLHYADDDGAKYAELFRTLMPADNVALLAEFDADSRGLYPRLASVALAPTRKALNDQVDSFARRAQQALDIGQRVEFYFVYAGHGDVEKGGGFVELKDGRFTSADLKALLKRMPASAAHVIVDSCNSFFLIHSRKPGGRRFATPEDAATALGSDLKHVGFFLSTNAEAEVYEWSELQSGIFSHVVRSGLLGAADANSDNRIGYRELQAFVDSAVGKIKNPSYRPRVFSRPPGGQERTMLDLRDPKVAQLSIDQAPAMRITVRDHEGIPWIDLHKESGAKIALRLPRRLQAGFWVEELSPQGRITSTRHHTPIPQTDEATKTDPVRLALANLPSSGSESHARKRGPADQLRVLFASPFGPKAYARFQTTPQVKPIYGLARQDIERMDLLLSHAADAGRRYRLREGGLGLALSAGLSFGSWLSFRTERSTNGWIYGAGAAITGAAALANFFGKSETEKTREFFLRQMRNPNLEPALVAVQTAARLERIGEQARTDRKIMSIVSYSGAGVLAAVGGYAVYDGETEAGLVIGGMGLAFVGLGLWAQYNETPVERVIKIWRNDSSIFAVPQLSLVPTRGGATLGLSGQF